MHNVGINLRKSLRALLLCLCLAYASSSIGCLYAYTDFRPVKDELPIIFFDRYQAEIHGYAAGNHNFFCDFAFLDSIADTANMDTIPVLIIDSVCFRGACLDSDFCARPSSWYERQQDAIRKGRGTPDPRDSMWLEKYRDLYYSNGKLVPGGYGLINSIRFPESCYNLDIVVEMHARLLDRLSQAEIARESRSIQFRIKRGVHPGMG